MLQTWAICWGKFNFRLSTINWKVIKGGYFLSIYLFIYFTLLGGGGVTDVNHMTDRKHELLEEFEKRKRVR